MFRYVQDRVENLQVRYFDVASLRRETVRYQIVLFFSYRHMLIIPHHPPQREQALVGLGAREVDWLAGVLDVQLFSAVPDTRLRDELFAEALAVAVSWHGRVEQTEAILLQKLFTDAGLKYSPPLTDDTEVQTPRRMKDCERVGIYSLSESAAKNAARWIRDEWPDTEVRLSHAHSNNSDLDGLVRSSDVVLLHTSHAKHAATMAIERLIGRSRLVRVNGRGASSLFRSLLAWATSAG